METRHKFYSSSRTLDLGNCIGGNGKLSRFCAAVSGYIIRDAEACSDLFLMDHD